MDHEGQAEEAQETVSANEPIPPASTVTPERHLSNRGSGDATRSALHLCVAVRATE